MQLPQMPGDALDCGCSGLCDLQLPSCQACGGRLVGLDQALQVG